MHTHRKTLGPAANAALALGAFSGLILTPQTAFAGSGITDIALFNNTNGASPNGGITLDSNGNLYGTTEYGGANGDGVVYEIANADPSPAPEPAQTATFALVMTGLTALLLRAQRRKV